MFDTFRKRFIERMALNNMTAGNSLKAEKWYRKLEAMEPDNRGVLHNLGVISIALKKFSDAERYIKREIEIYGESGINLRILGDLYYTEGSMDRAGKIYGRALALLQKSGGDESTRNFIRKRITICKDKSLYARALESSRIIEKGAEHVSRGEFRDALELYLKAAEYDKSSYMALNGAGTVLLNHVKDYNRARECFRKALELADIPVIKSNLALSEFKISGTGGSR